MAKVLPHVRIGQLLAGQGTRMRWPHVLGLLDQLRQDPSPEAENALVDAAMFDGEIRLDPGPGYPHSMPPEQLLKLLAIQLLARKNLSRHRKLIRRIATNAHSDRVRETALQLSRR
jgi:hypothetical protein